jgi:6,7-dimethyl-8-ribityllumazine synthase
MSLDAPSQLSIDGTPFTVGVVAARYNPRLVEALLAQVTRGLRAAGVKEKRLHIVRVPGSNELPSAAQLLLRRHRCDVVVALGVIIRGGTLHYELVAQAATDGLLRVSLDARVPVITGVVVAENQKQAEERCLGEIDRGAEFARAALEMAALKKALSS